MIFKIYLIVFFALKASAVLVPWFKDRTALSGLQDLHPQRKYGGPSIADLDGDGHLDLLLSHHDSTFMQVYFNNGNGTFTKSPFRRWHDIHGIIPFPRSAWSPNMLFLVCRGGRHGTEPISPAMFEVRPDRSITEVTEASGIGKRKGRGRSAVIMNNMAMNRRHFWPDILLTNARPNEAFRPAPNHHAFENVGYRKFLPRHPLDLAFLNNHYALATDLDGDRNMEIISFQNLTVFKLVSPFHFKDISDSVLPSHIPRAGVIAVAELDFDNDGDFDLYVARTNTTDLSWVKEPDFHDLLLENRNGKYVDVTQRRGIPPSRDSRGVTIGDFNNDGYMDIFVSRYTHRDMLLLNDRKGGFIPISGLVDRPRNVAGDMAIAADYDSDGRLDIISSQGDHMLEGKLGTYRIFRNKIHLTFLTRFILVRVGSAHDRSATPLHAVVSVSSFGLKQVRRVGTAGAQVSKSYINVLHFGLGWRWKVDRIKVVWSSGTKQVKFNLKSNSMVTFGASA